MAKSPAHVQVIKHRQGKKLEKVEIHYAHGSQTRIAQALAELGFKVPNTSSIERYNGTARLMDSSQVRKTLAFAKHDNDKRQ